MIPYLLTLAWDSVLGPTYPLACILSVSIIQSNHLTPNILSALYLRQSGIAADRLRRCVVAFSINFACATLILYLSFKSYGVIFECCSDDMNVRGCFNYSGCSSGSVMTPSVTIFPCFLLCIISAIFLLVTNSATRLCSSIVLPSILFDWFLHTHKLSTILLLNSCVLKITSSSSTNGVSPESSSDSLKLMARLKIFCDSIFSYT